jgi:hypothetical protein
LGDALAARLDEPGQPGLGADVVADVTQPGQGFLDQRAPGREKPASRPS